MPPYLVGKAASSEAIFFDEPVKAEAGRPEWSPTPLAKPAFHPEHEWHGVRTPENPSQGGGDHGSALKALPMAPKSYAKGNPGILTERIHVDRANSLVSHSRGHQDGRTGSRGNVQRGLDNRADSTWSLCSQTSCTKEFHVHETSSSTAERACPSTEEPSLKGKRTGRKQSSPDISYASSLGGALHGEGRDAIVQLIHLSGCGGEGGSTATSSKVYEPPDHGDFTSAVVATSALSAIPHATPSLIHAKTPSTASSAVVATLEGHPIPYRCVAVKRIYKAELCRTQVLHSLRNEVLFGSQLRHPCLLNVFGVTEDNDCVYLVMDLAENGNLADYLNHYGVEETREMAPRFLADVVLALEHLSDGRQHLYHASTTPLDSSIRPPDECSGKHTTEEEKEGGGGGRGRGSFERTPHTAAERASLRADSDLDESRRQLLHDSIIQHRDLKPKNLLLTWDYHVKIADFGSSCYIGNHDCNRFGGSPAYISPEVIIENKAGPYSDLWALGCVLYELTQGVSPFKSNTAFCTTQKIKKFQAGTLTFPQAISPEARDLVERLLQPNPTDRLGAAEQGGFAGLKRHPFFREIAWDGVLERANLTPRNTDYTLELAGHLFADETVVYGAVVEVLAGRSLPPLFAEEPCRCLCLLVLTDRPRLLLVLPCRGAAVALPWSDALRVAVDAEGGETAALRIWSPPLPHPLRLRDLSGRPDVWRGKIHDAIHPRSPATTATATAIPPREGIPPPPRLLHRIRAARGCRKRPLALRLLPSGAPS
ncbi:unnamed protein product [Phytomonas sp. EM1]|nr:unnamed protein product [Phytomonas sp. EM1]|eukprot:CCW65620.1 unnamed protein product [Phytomonas sp. isolate EM1]